MLGYISLERRGDGDRILANLAQDLVARGVALVGMVHNGTSRGTCEMVLRLLPDGPEMALSQPMEAGSDVCALDPGALEQVVVGVERQLEVASLQTGLPALMILNKFGKQEAAGRGCRGLIARALALGVPVLLSVPPETRAAFDAFTDGLAEEIAPDPAALRQWLVRVGVV